jgi:hypothetical protein
MAQISSISAGTPWLKYNLSKKGYVCELHEPCLSKYKWEHHNQERMFSLSPSVIFKTAALWIVPALTP